jgi:hypothetical protein
LQELPPQQRRDLSTLLLPGLDRIGRKDLQAKAYSSCLGSPSPEKEGN